jgi:hypothetical protein
MTVRLALFEDKLAPGRPLEWPAAPRVIYVRWGVARAISSAGRQVMSIESCGLFTDALRIEGDGDIWTFELSAVPVAGMSLAEKTRSILAHDIDLDPAAPVLFRADRVQFPPGAVTPRHGHKGAGIRRLIYGRLVAEIGEEVRRIEAGMAWFESGKDPVIGRNVAPASAFVRGLALDPALKGQPTFIPWSPEEAAKPRGTRPTQFFDEIVDLPPAR